jgi:hypothetical protein
MNGRIKKFENSVYADFRLIDFILDESNQLSYNQVKQWIDAVKSGQVEHFHIYGGCGNGKSHLAAGAINAILEARSTIPSYSVNIEYLCRHMKEIPKNSILLCEGMWSLLDSLSPIIVESCSAKNTSVIFTSDKKIQSFNVSNSAEIFAPTEILLQKVVDSKIDSSNCNKSLVLLGGSVRETLHLIRKELLKREIAMSEENHNIQKQKGIIE